MKTLIAIILFHYVLLFAFDSEAAEPKYYIELELRYDETQARKIEYKKDINLFDSLLECGLIRLSNEFKLSLVYKYRDKNIEGIRSRCKKIYLKGVQT